MILISAGLSGTLPAPAADADAAAPVPVPVGAALAAAAVLVSATAADICMHHHTHNTRSQRLVMAWFGRTIAIDHRRKSNGPNVIYDDDDDFQNRIAPSSYANFTGDRHRLVLGLSAES